MNEKRRHVLIGFATMLGILLFSIPIFFQDVEVMPYFWFSYRLPTPPKMPTIPDWTRPMAPVVDAEDENFQQQQGWVVRLAASPNLQHANDQIQQLQAQKFNAFRALNPHDLHIYIGPEFNYQAAQQKLRQLPESIRKTATVARYEL